jgi:IclR family mhp operon transcriptional activator
MESTRPIRALLRGLDALTVLNMRDGATVSEIAHEIRLPRTTVYRILETLCESGFAFRDTADERYRLTVSVRGLSSGFEDDAWMTQGARSVIHTLGREIIWPVSLATPSGNGMLVRETTDHSTPLAIDRYSAGMRAPLLTSAAGRAYLAFCPATERERLLDALAQSNKEDDKLAKGPRADLLRTLSDIKLQGYATVSRMRHLVEEINLAVPVTLADDVLAVLSIRFAASTVPIKTAVERFLPRLRECAAEVRGSYSEYQAEAHVKSAPETAV